MMASQGAIFTIQRAQKINVIKIKQLILKSGLNPTALNWRNFFIAKDTDGNFIACGQVKVHVDGTMEMASLAVKKDWHHKGVGSALVERLLEKYPIRLYLMCQSSLGSYYEKFGFQAIDEAEMPKYFRRVGKLAGVLKNLREDGETLLIMRRFGNSPE